MLFAGVRLFHFRKAARSDFLNHKVAVILQNRVGDVVVLGGRLRCVLVLNGGRNFDSRF